MKKIKNEELNIENSFGFQPIKFGTTDLPLSFIRFQLQIAPQRIMVGIADLVDRAVDRFHVGGMQDVVDPEPEEVFIISDSDTTAGSGISIFQRPLDRTMCIRNRSIVEVAADQYIIGIDLFNFLSDCSRLTGAYPECGT